MKALFFSLLTAMMLAHPALAQETPDESESGLALPRMVSLRSNLINARSGPGARYPIEWVYMQKGAPVEIVAEFQALAQNQRLAGFGIMGSQVHALRPPFNQDEHTGREQCL
ncbi:MAG: hypothetical protein V8R23_00280 [Alphaproteobacteria bacterium]